MRQAILHTIRAKIGKWLLDWAESSPAIESDQEYLGRILNVPKELPIQGSNKWFKEIVRDLQRTRWYQRNASDREYYLTRPPKGVSIDYLTFRMTEVFHVNDVQNLSEKILKCFPQLSDDGIHGNFLGDYNRIVSPFSLGGEMRLGYFSRTRRPLAMGAYRIIGSLPEEVNYIQCTLHKVYPSIIMIYFDVYLNNLVTTKLRDIQSKKYLPAVKLQNIHFFRDRTYFSFSQTTARRELSVAISSWQQSIRKKIEKEVKSYFSGYFLRQQDNDMAQLPVVEIYGLKDFDELGKDWTNKCRIWLSSLNLDIQLAAFGHDKIIVSQPDYLISDDTLRLSYLHTCQLIVLRKHYLASVNLEMYGGDENNAILHTIEYFLNALSPYIIVDSILSLVELQVQVIRNSVAKINLKRGGIEKYVHIYNTVREVSQFFDILVAEFELFKQTDSSKDDIASLKSLDYPDRMELNLYNNVVVQIDRRSKIIRHHLDYISSLQSNVLNLRNIQLSYSIQRIILLVTLIIGLPSLFPYIVKIWEYIKPILEDVLLYLNWL